MFMIAKVSLSLLFLLPLVFSQLLTIEQKPTESGRATVVQRVFFNQAGFRLSVYVITYTTVFQNIPSMLIGIDSISNCLANSSHYIRAIRQEVVSTVTSYQFLGHQARYFDPNYDLKLRYFAIDTIKLPHAQVNTQWTDIPSQNYSMTFNFLKVKIEQTKTVVMCFLLAFDRILVMTMPFTVQTQAKIVNSSQIICSFNSNVNNTHPTIYLKYSAIAMNLDSPVHRVVHAVSSYVQGNFSRSSLVNYDEDYSEVFIGLTSVILTTPCLMLNLNENMDMNESSINIQKVDYTVFQFIYKTFSIEQKILHFPFLDKRELTIGIVSEFDVLELQLIDKSANIQSLEVVNKSIVARTNIDYYEHYYKIDFKIRNSAVLMKQSIFVSAICVSKVSANYQNSTLMVMFKNVPQDLSVQILNQTRVKIFYEINRIATFLQVWMEYSQEIIGQSFKMLCVDSNGHENIFEIIVPKLLSMTLNDEQPQVTTIRHQDFLDKNANLQTQQNIIQTSPLTTTINLANQAIPFPVEIKAVFSRMVKVQFSELKKQYRVTLENPKVVTALNFSDYAITPSQLKLKEILVINQTFVTLVLGTDSTKFGHNQKIRLEYSPQQLGYTIVLDNINRIPSVSAITSQKQENLVTIKLKNTNGSNDKTKNPEIKLFHDQMSLVDIKFTQQEVILNCRITDKIKQNFLVIELNTNNSASRTIQVDLTSSQLVYYQQQHQAPTPTPPSIQILESSPQHRIVNAVSTALLVLYYSFFLVSLISQRKQYGTQLMSIIQYSYFSLALVRNNGETFAGLNVLRYSNGWNPLFQNIENNQLPQFYSRIGVQAAFLSNVNIMVFIVILCYLMFLILKLISKRPAWRQSKMERLSKSFLFQIPITVLKFSSINIFYSFRISISYSQNTLSFIFSGFCCISLLILLPVFLYYKTLYQQFDTEQDNQIPNVRWRKAFELINLILNIILSVIISFSQDQFLYLSMAFIVLFKMGVLIVYSKLLGWKSVTYLLHALTLFGIFLLPVLNYQSQYNTQFAKYYPAALLLILLFGLLNTGIYSLQKSIQFWKNEEQQPYLQQHLQQPQKQSQEQRRDLIQDEIDNSRAQLNAPPLDQSATSKINNTTIPSLLHIDTAENSKYRCWFQELKQNQALSEKLGIDYSIIKNIFLTDEEAQQNKCEIIMKWILAEDTFKQTDRASYALIFQTQCEYLQECISALNEQQLGIIKSRDINSQLNFHQFIQNLKQ